MRRRLLMGAAAMLAAPALLRDVHAPPSRRLTPAQTEGPFYPVTLLADTAFQGFGRVAVGAAGEYRFRTIRPVACSGRTPHIHVKAKLARRKLLTTQVYVEGDPHNERDFLWRGLDAADRAALTVPFQPGPDGLRARFSIVVAA